MKRRRRRGGWEEGERKGRGEEESKEIESRLGAVTHAYNPQEAGMGGSQLEASLSKKFMRPHLNQ
jgi:hypothetical protein